MSSDRSTPGLMIAAPNSGSGKTTVTLGLLRALANAGQSVRSAKSGPDYIDPQFHAAASRAPCINLDAWAMSAPSLLRLAAEHTTDSKLLVVEAAMGLFDGAANGEGSAADLAQILDIPVILVIDCARQSQSVAALVSGFTNFRPGLGIAGLILNRVGSPRHEALLRNALDPLGIPILGMLASNPKLVVPSRHLGLLQAEELPELDAFLTLAADEVANGFDLVKLSELAKPVGSSAVGETSSAVSIPPLGQRVAIARDRAFAFAYPHMLDAWQRAGAELSFFSPLADEAPAEQADSIFLPGGYPELHAGRLAGNSRFKDGLSKAASSNLLIYGECGGYMALGERLIDADGQSHSMCGLLPLVTSFEKRRRHLGYRNLRALSGAPWPAGQTPYLAGHEFHYASIIEERGDNRLFSATDAMGTELSAMGLWHGSVMGSFAHVISARG